MRWEAVIGLEVHVQLNTRSKLFSGEATTFGAEPNTQVCAIDLGMPGVLPVLNKEAVRMAIKFGLAIDAKICTHSIFTRKNYFYPDLPKGYQISQHELPIISGGHLTIHVEGRDKKTINITRVHLEEDAGKSLHEHFHDMTAIDLNRAGIPLIEIVSEPDLRSAKEAITYLKTLRTLIRYLEISDANMQEGSFRCDANVSIRPHGNNNLGARTEIKNLNSFRFVEKAIDYEIKRQIDVVVSGKQVVQETRLYDDYKNVTKSMRIKEEAKDYRYFPDPDLLPISLDECFISEIRNTLPELPEQKLLRLQQEYGLTQYESEFLTNNKGLANYFEECAKHCTTKPKLLSNWIIGELTAALKRANLEPIASPIKPHQLALLVNRIADNTISGKSAKTVFKALWDKDGEVDEIIETKELKQIADDAAIEKTVKTIITNNPQQAEQYRNGEKKLLVYLVGQVMKETKGRANPQQVNTLLKKNLCGDE